MPCSTPSLLPSEAFRRPTVRNWGGCLLTSRRTEPTSRGRRGIANDRTLFVWPQGCPPPPSADLSSFARKRSRGRILPGRGGGTPLFPIASLRGASHPRRAISPHAHSPRLPERLRANEQRIAVQSHYRNRYRSDPHEHPGPSSAVPVVRIRGTPEHRGLAIASDYGLRQFLLPLRVLVAGVDAESLVEATDSLFVSPQLGKSASPGVPACSKTRGYLHRFLMATELLLLPPKEAQTCALIIPC